MKKIGILTSGGDAPGMNAAIYGVVKNAEKAGYQVRGFQDGYDGLIDNKYKEITSVNAKPHLNYGGTFIGTARSQRFMDPTVRQSVVERLNEEDVVGLVIIGGDGSYKGALELTRLGVPVITIPGTIDNDIPNTELTLGFKTAMSNVVNTVDIIMQSAASHRHLYAIEVMGRRAGDIALWTGTALGADGIICHPSDFDIEEINETIKESQAAGHRYQLFIIAEGAMSAEEFKHQVETHTNFSIHPLLLGHIQRGGDPVLDDRILGQLFGQVAFEALVNKEAAKNLAVQNNQIVLQDITDTLAATKQDIYPFNSKEFIKRT